MLNWVGMKRKLGRLPPQHLKLYTEHRAHFEAARIKRDIANASYRKIEKEIQRRTIASRNKRI